jgi:ketosteroid isomerase-like protein
MVDTEAEKAEVETVLGRVEAAENRKDIDGMLEHVTEDGLLLMAGAPLIQGPDAWRASYQKFFGGGFISTSLTCLGREVSASGDMAWDYGTFVSTFAGPDGPTYAEGKFLQVWRKVNGRWKGAAVSIG